MSRQAFNIIHEVDELMQPNLQERVFEAHPELAFMGLVGRPMRHKKKTPAGWREREALVALSFGRHYMGPSQVLDRFGRSRLATDDVLDAYVLAITAERNDKAAAQSAQFLRHHRDRGQCAHETDPRPYAGYLVARGFYDAWMDPDLAGSPTAESVFIRPYPGEHMWAYPVGTAVNNPKNDKAELMREA